MIARLRVWWYRKVHRLALDRDERQRADDIAMMRTVRLGCRDKPLVRPWDLFGNLP